MSHRLVRASAGTGKTYQLVQAYVGQIEEGRRPHEIVVLTFTRKAAAELRTRIRAELGRRGADAALIADLGRAPIANFHGLSLQMLRGMGWTAQVPEGLRLLGDAGDDRLLFFAACEAAWFGTDGHLAAEVDQVARHLDLEAELMPAAWDAFAQAREDGRALEACALLAWPDPEHQGRLHQALMTLRQNLAAVIGEQTAKGRAQLEAFLAAPLPAADATPEVWAEAWRDAGRCLDGRAKYKRVFDSAQRILIRETVWEPVADAVGAALIPALARLLDAGWQGYVEAKARTRQLDFADLVERVVQALETQPGLHGHWRGRIQSVMVDEAQDTNRIQRRLVHLLAGLEGPAATAGQEADLFVVGDRKQAIYTFRGADPDSFEGFARDIEGLGGTCDLLTVSRRSHPGLVGAINSLGARLFPDGYEALEPLEANVSEAEPRVDHVEALPSPVPAMGEAATVAEFLATRVAKGEAAGNYALLLATMTQAPMFARALAQRGIPAVLGSGGGLYEQPEVHDVVALLSWLVDGADHLAAAIALRSPLVGCSDDGLYTVFADHRRGLSALRRGRCPAFLSSEDQQALQPWVLALPRLVTLAARGTASEVLASVLTLGHARARYLGLDEGEQRVQNLDRLAELAAEADQRGLGGVMRFAREQQQRIRWGHREPLVPVPAAARRTVTITTVHQSKGLEYPRVILADLRGAGRADSGSLRYERSQGVVFRSRYRGQPLEGPHFRAAKDAVRQGAYAERRRLLYVAFTRARDRVVVVSRVEDTPPPRGSFAEHLEPWLPEATEAGWVVHHGRVFSATSSPRSAPALPPRAVSLPRYRPPPLQTRTVTVAVTDLAHLLECPRRSIFAEDAGEGGALRPRGLAISDPWRRDRGVAAHGVLEQLHRCPATGDPAAFVDRTLARLGWDATDLRLGTLRDELVGFLQGPLGCALRHMPPDRRRHEWPFRLRVPAGECELILQGQIDLVTFDHNVATVVDFKHAQDLGRNDAYLHQLKVYAAAVAAHGWTGSIRTQLVSLRDPDASVEQNVTSAVRESFLGRCREVAEQLVVARSQRQLPPEIALSRCRALECVFLSRCHPGNARRPRRRTSALNQLELPLPSPDDRPSAEPPSSPRAG